MLPKEEKYSFWWVQYGTDHDYCNLISGCELDQRSLPESWQPKERTYSQGSEIGNPLANDIVSEVVNGALEVVDDVPEVVDDVKTDDVTNTDRKFEENLAKFKKY